MRQREDLEQDNVEMVRVERKSLRIQLVPIFGFLRRGVNCVLFEDDLRRQKAKFMSEKSRVNEKERLSPRLWLRYSAIAFAKLNHIRIV